MYSNQLYEQYVTSVEGDSESGSFVLRTRDAALAALMRKSILEAVPCAAIGHVKFLNRPIRVPDEVIAMHLAQLVIDNRRLATLDSFTVRATVEGPAELSTYDIPLPFAHYASICPVEAGETLDIEITCNVGTQYDHAKYAVATSNVDFVDTDNGFLFTVELIGSKPIEDVVLDAFYNMPQVMATPPTSIYTRLVIVDQASLQLLKQISQDQ